MLLKFLLAGLFGLSLSAIYFMPMFFEREFVHIEWLKNGPWRYNHNFLDMAQSRLSLFYIQLKRIVMLYLLLVIISLILACYKWIKYRTLPNFYQFLFFLLIFAFSLFISTSFSTPIWELIPGFPTIHFPWRWLMVSTFATSVMIGLTFNSFSLEDIKNNRFIRICMAVFLALFISNLYLSLSYIMTAKPMQKKELELILMGRSDVIEYRPIWLTDKKKDFSQEPWVPVVFKEGVGNIDVLDWQSQSRAFRVDAALPSVLRVSTFYYPGWTALNNGREIPIGIEKDSGAMLINIPPGKNEVLLEFRDTPLRTVAKWISIVSLLAALFGLAMAKRKSY